MTSIALSTIDRHPWTRIAGAVRSEVGLARLGDRRRRAARGRRQLPAAEPGDSAGDHLAGGLVPLALLVAAAALYGRAARRARARRSRSSSASSASSPAPRPSTTRWSVGPSGDDYTGLLSIPAGLLAARPRRGDAVEVAAPRRPALVALRAPAAPRRRRCRRRVRRPVPVTSPTSSRTRHAHVSRRRPRRALRGRRVQDERRAAAEGLVHPVAKRRRRDLVPGPRLAPRSARSCSRATATASCSSTAAARARARATRTSSAGRASGTSTRPSRSCRAARTSTRIGSAASASRSAAR